MTESAILIVAAISAGVAIILLVRAMAALLLAETAVRRAMDLNLEAASLADKAKSLACEARAKMAYFAVGDLDEIQKSIH